MKEAFESDKDVAESVLHTISDIKVDLKSDNDDEPVIYTLDLTHHNEESNSANNVDDENSLENNLQYLINESGSLIISTTNNDGLN